MRRLASDLGRGHLSVGGRLLGAGLALALAGACDDAQGPRPDGDPSADAAGTSNQRVTLSEIEQTIFATNCAFSVCHGVESPQRGLSLVSPTYARLVNVQSSTVAKQRVVPFAPEASYLLEKLQLDRPAAGKRMPPDQPLPDADIQKIKAWIEQGALND